jgi:hypothetical protein
MEIVFTTNCQLGFKDLEDFPHNRSAEHFYRGQFIKNNSVLKLLNQYVLGQNISHFVNSRLLCWPLGM